MEIAKKKKKINYSINHKSKYCKQKNKNTDRSSFRVCELVRSSGNQYSFKELEKSPVHIIKKKSRNVTKAPV